MTSLRIVQFTQDSINSQNFIPWKFGENDIIDKSSVPNFKFYSTKNNFRKSFIERSRHSFIECKKEIIWFEYLPVVIMSSGWELSILNRFRSINVVYFNKVLLMPIHDKSTFRNSITALFIGYATCSVLLFWSISAGEIIWDYLKS